MKRYLFVMVLSFPVLGAAQQAPVNVLQFKWNVSSKERTQPALYSQTSYHSLIRFQPIKYTLPKTAIFCRMEHAVYKRFNFLFKIRMGSDDKYSD